MVSNSSEGASSVKIAIGRYPHLKTMAPSIIPIVLRWPSCTLSSPKCLWGLLFGFSSDWENPAGYRKWKPLLLEPPLSGKRSTCKGWTVHRGQDMKLRYWTDTYTEKDGSTAIKFADNIWIRCSVWRVYSIFHLNLRRVASLIEYFSLQAVWFFCKILKKR